MNQLCWICVNLASFPKFNWKGRHLTIASKSNSADWVLGLGPNTGFSLELGVGISVDVDSTYSTWTLMLLGTTGRNDTFTTSPLTSISAWYSSGWYSTVYNSAANKGYCNQTFCLVVLINITGTDLDFTLATHLFMTIPWSRLWCSACSTRHTALGCILVVCPGTVMTEFPGMHIGFFLEPIATCPVCPVTSSKFCQSFFIRSSGLGDSICSGCWDTCWDDTPNTLLLFVCEWWYTHSWENSKGLTPSRHTKESNPDVPHFSTNAL